MPNIWKNTRARHYRGLFEPVQRARRGLHKIKYPEIRHLFAIMSAGAAQSGLTTTLMISEAPERKVAYRRYPVILDDPEARKYASVIAHQGYDFKNYDKIAELEKK